MNIKDHPLVQKTNNIDPTILVAATIACSATALLLAYKASHIKLSNPEFVTFVHDALNAGQMVCMKMDNGNLIYGVVDIP